MWTILCKEASNHSMQYNICLLQYHVGIAITYWTVLKIDDHIDQPIWSGVRHVQEWGKWGGSLINIAIYIYQMLSIYQRPSIYDVQKKFKVFNPHSSPSTCIHIRLTLFPFEASKFCCHEIHIAFLRQRVQWPCGPKTEIPL